MVHPVVIYKTQLQWKSNHKINADIVRIMTKKNHLMRLHCFVHEEVITGLEQT